MVGWGRVKDCEISLEQLLQGKGIVISLLELKNFRVGVVVKWWYLGICEEVNYLEVQQRK